MTNDKPQAQAISPARQIKAAQVASVFNPMHGYLASLYPINPATGNPEMTEQLRNAHTRIEEASFWAIQSVLKFGTQQPPSPAAPPSDENPDQAEAPANETDGTESNATAGVIDPYAPVPSDSVTAI